MELSLSPVGLVNLHALARRLQRGFTNTPEAIASDLLAIATQTAGLPAADEEFRLTVPGGAWCGQMTRAGYGELGRPFLVAAVRTFK